MAVAYKYIFCEASVIQILYLQTVWLIMAPLFAIFKDCYYGVLHIFHLKAILGHIDTFLYSCREMPITWNVLIAKRQCSC